MKPIKCPICRKEEAKIARVLKTVNIRGERVEQTLPHLDTICLNKNCQLGVDASKLKDWVIRD